MSNSVIVRATLQRLNMPLFRPYKLSYRTYEVFEPFLVQISDDAGRVGFGDGQISPGSSGETREGGWQFIQLQLNEIVGLDPASAIEHVKARADENLVSGTAVVTALEALSDHPLLNVAENAALPLLTSTEAHGQHEIEEEVSARLEEGFATFKIKVGKDVDADLERVALYQKAIGARGTIRIDANRAYARDDGIRFASALQPDGIELFEQPCDDKDWDANAAVAAASVVPLMLDEPICTLADIRRAADIVNVGFCKLKLKRFGSLDGLRAGLELVRDCGMEPVLGDGLGSEIQGWMEGCVARSLIRNAGEFNGFLKARDRIFKDPLVFSDGALRMPAGYRPSLDAEAVDRLTTESFAVEA